jgi:hypothetical protein
MVMRWTKAMGSLPGYHPIRFDSHGAQLMVHQQGIRIIGYVPSRRLPAQDPHSADKREARLPALYQI